MTIKEKSKLKTKNKTSDYDFTDDTNILYVNYKLLRFNLKDRLKIFD